MGNKKISLITAICMILIGLMFIILQGMIVRYVLTFVGALVIVWGVIDLVHKLTVPGVIKILIGAAVIVLGWFVFVVMLYVVAVLMVAYGVYELVRIIKQRPIFNIHLVLYCMKPVLTLLAGIFLMFNQSGAVSWIFIVTGILLMVDGIVLLLSLMPD